MDKKAVKSKLLPVSLETEIPAPLKKWSSATERNICFTALKSCGQLRNNIFLFSCSSNNFKTLPGSKDQALLAP